MKENFYISQDGCTVYNGKVKDILTESFNTPADANMTNEDLTEWITNNPDKLIICTDRMAATLPNGTIKDVVRLLEARTNKDGIIVGMEVSGYAFFHSHSQSSIEKDERFKAYIDDLVLTTPADQVPNTLLKPTLNIFSHGNLDMTNEASLNETFTLPTDVEVEVTAFSIMEEASQSHDINVQMKTLEKALPYLKDGETIAITGANIDGSLWEEQITRTSGILVSVVTAPALDNEGVPKTQTILNYVQNLSLENAEPKLENTDAVEINVKKAPAKIGIIGAGPGKTVAGALAALDAMPKASAESIPENKAVTPPPQQTASMIIAKLRARGTDVVIQFIKATSIGQIEHLKRGLYAYYTLNQSIAGMSGRKLAIGVHQNTSVITKGALDWLLDQLGENIAFEVRANRFNVDPNKTYVISKTKEEWLAKGFEVNPFGTVVLN